LLKKQAIKFIFSKKIHIKINNMSFQINFFNKINQLYVDTKINIMFNILIKTRYTVNKMIEILNFKKGISDKAPDGCDFVVDEFVTYTNKNGVKFGPYKIIGFAKGVKDVESERFIHLNNECYWFPVKLEEIKKL